VNGKSGLAMLGNIFLNRRCFKQFFYPALCIVSFVPIEVLRESFHKTNQGNTFKRLLFVSLNLPFQLRLLREQIHCFISILLHAQNPGPWFLNAEQKSLFCALQQYADTTTAAESRIL